jgi:hypothetical protein
VLYDKRWEKQLEIQFDEPWRQILWDAAAYIDRRGWCQHNMEDAEGAVCMLGAVRAAAKSNKVERGKALLALTLNLGNMDVANWNDSHKRTKAQVVGKLRSVAQKR